MTFSDHAAKLAAAVCVLLGWRPGDFWEATPAEVAGLLATIGGGDEAGAAGAGDLARLKEMFPDG